MENEEKNTEKTLKQKLLKRIALTSLISALLPLSLLLSVPFEIFANNFDEFVFTLSDFYPVLVGFFFLTFFAIFLILFFLPKRAFRIVGSVFIALAFMCFIQENYLNGKLSSLKGDYLEGNGITKTTEVVNMSLWVAAVVVAVILACFKDRKNIISYIALILSCIVLVTQIITPVSVAISKNEVFMNHKQRVEAMSGSDKRYILSDKNITNPSQNSNIFWFIIDRFDESFAERAYETNPEVFGELEGFTWFKDNLAVYTHTYPSIAQMLTNNPYDPHKQRAYYLNESYQNAETLKILNDNGYSVNLYTQPYFGFTDAANLPEFIANRSETVTYGVTDKPMLSLSVAGLALYRVLPFTIKKHLNLDSSTSNNFLEEKDCEDNYKYNTQKFPDKEFVTKGDKGFYFIHTEGCHEATEPKKGSKLVVKNFEKINEYLRFLKEQGLYENATIIITGDHGVANNYGYLYRPSMAALFVKPSGSTTSPLAFSYAPTQHYNLWATIFKSEGIKTDKDYGKSVFEIDENAQIERYLISHSYGRTFVQVTYKITGRAGDFNNWEKTDEFRLNKALMD